MTGLNGVSILLGKYVSRLLNALMLLIVQIPFVLLSITLGGVSVEQILAVFATLASMLFFVSAAALLWSVLCGTTRAAGAWTFLSLLVFFAGLPLGWAMTTPPMFMGQPDWFHDWVLTTNAFYRLMMVIDIGFDNVIFGYQFWTNMAAGGGLCLATWWLFDYGTRHHLVSSPQRGMVFFKTARSRRQGRRAAWSAALAWKDFHFIGGGVPMLLGKLVVYVLICLLIWGMMEAFAGQYYDHEEVGATLLSLFLVLLTLDIAVTVARCVREEVRWRTGELLGMLPTNTAGVLYPKFAGALICTIPTVLFVLVSLVVAGERIRDDCWDAFFRDEPVGWMFLGFALLFIHLSALFAVPLRFGAVVLAGAAVIGLGILNGMVIDLIDGGGIDEDVVIGFLALEFMAISAVCHPLMLVWYERKIANL